MGETCHVRRSETPMTLLLISPCFYEGVRLLVPERDTRTLPPPRP